MNNASSIAQNPKPIKKRTSFCKTCNKKFSYFRSVSLGKYCCRKCCYKCPEWLEKQKVAKIGRKHSLEARKKMSLARKGKLFSVEWKKNMSLAQKGKPRPWTSGKNHYNWQSGKTEKTRGIRLGSRYRMWRKKVLVRDKYSCVFCGSDNNICVDHIIPFASILYESKILGTKRAIYDVDNGRTLCKKCHLSTGTYNSKLENQTEYRYMRELELWWKQSYSNNMEFDEFYRMQTEKIIDKVKEKLHE